MSDYTTREMMEAFDQTPPVKTFLQKTFFPTEETHVSEKVEFDVRKGKRIMAPLVSPRMGGKVITRQGFRTNQFTTPKIAPERPMTIDDITQRAIGENIYSLSLIHIFFEGQTGADDPRHAGTSRKGSRREIKEFRKHNSSQTVSWRSYHYGRGKFTGFLGVKTYPNRLNGRDRPLSGQRWNRRKPDQVS